MAESPIEQLTLRELFKQSERLVREAIEHLEQSFAPKAHQLATFVGTQEGKLELTPATDVAIRNQAAAILASDDFSQTLYRKLDEYLAAIDQGARRALGD